MKKIKLIGTALAISLLLFSCSGTETTTTESVVEETVVEEGLKTIDPMQDKGVGVITSIELGELDQTMADAGKEIFTNKCKACHKMGKRFVGPDLTAVTTRRTPEWIMNMILDPEKMVTENKNARDLLMEYSAPMANQSLTEEEARNVLEYFRTVN